MIYIYAYIPSITLLILTSLILTFADFEQYRKLFVNIKYAPFARFSRCPKNIWLGL